MATSLDSSARMLPSARVLAAAPHRLLFLVGAGNVLLAMLWWAAWLADLRWQLFALPQPSQPAGWMHALVMQYQVLPSFFFGFLLTVFPRWLGLAELSRWHYLPVGIGLMGGQLLTLLGLLGLPVLVHVGALFTLAGWITGTALLLNLLRQDRARRRTLPAGAVALPWHPISCAAAMAIGTVGWALYVLGLHLPGTMLIPWSIRLGGFGLLLPVFFTVAHRMFPFFANNVVAGYRPWRPMWLLAAFWPLAMGHLALELAGATRWLWLTSLPLAALSGLFLLRGWPRAKSPALLRVLFIGYAWLPLAMLLYATQSLALLAFDAAILGRAPAHALFVGFFGSLLVAMVTRVTQGHSGRPLELGRVAGLCFVLVQGVALLRIAADAGVADYWAWMAAAAVAWVLAFAPWVLRSAWIYLTPRIDRRPG